MSAATRSQPITYLSAPLSALDVDLLVVPWFDGESPGRFSSLDQAISGELSRALASKEFAARPFDLFMTPIADRRWKAKRVAFIGAGNEMVYETAMARKVAAAAGYAARQRRLSSLAFVLRAGQPDPSGDVDVASLLQ